jgi:hypothetical protein
MTLAAVHRLVHHATIFELNVESSPSRLAQQHTRPGEITAYGHGARYLAKLATLAEGIADWKNLDNHTAYALGLRKSHGRKAGFWSLTEARPKP